MWGWQAEGGGWGVTEAFTTARWAAQQNATHVAYHLALVAAYAVFYVVLTGGRGRRGGVGVCCYVNPLFLPIDVQHTQCPRRFSIVKIKMCLWLQTTRYKNIDAHGEYSKDIWLCNVTCTGYVRRVIRRNPKKNIACQRKRQASCLLTKGRYRVIC